MTSTSETARAGTEPTAVTETEAVILEAARDVLAEGGMGALSMRALAERVGLSATAIYHHFEGKDDLVRRVVRLGYQRFGEYLEKAVADRPAGSLDRVLAVGEGYVRFAFENKEYFRVLYSIQDRIPRHLDDLPGGGGYHLLRQCIVDAMESGEIRHSDADQVSHYLWASVHGMVTLGLACDMKDTGCSMGTGEGDAVELFRSFGTFLRDGLRGVPEVDEQPHTLTNENHGES